MTRIVVKWLVWDEFNTEHIKKHNVTIEEVETAIKHLVTHKKGKKGKYMLFGRTAKRILALIAGREGENTYYIVSARDADKPERRRVYEKERKQTT
jgi:uncharacterized DUF497 family protein